MSAQLAERIGYQSPYLSLDGSKELWTAWRVPNDDPMLLDLINIIVTDKYESGELIRHGNLYCPHGQHGLEIAVNTTLPQDVWEALFLAMYRADVAVILIRKTDDGRACYEWGYPTGYYLIDGDSDIEMVHRFVTDL